MSNFFFVQKQFSRPARVGWQMRDVGQGVDVAAQEPAFSLADGDVTFADLGTPLAQALDFPAGQGQSGFEGFLDGVIVSGPTVPGDGGIRGLGLGFPAHGVL